MNDETQQWLRYADENLRSAQLLLEHSLFNPCLQNAQQAVEKSLKAALIEHAIPLRRTHSINELTKMLAESGITIDVTEEDCDLLDSSISRPSIRSVAPYPTSNQTKKSAASVLTSPQG